MRADAARRRLPIRSLARFARGAAALLLAGFLLNLVWENAQAPLFERYNGFLPHLPQCLAAAALDALLVLLLYAAVGLMLRSPGWAVEDRGQGLAVLVILGILLGIGLEVFALLEERWDYKQEMPLLPGTGVAALPVLQMALLPALSVRAAARWLKP